MSVGKQMSIIPKRYIRLGIVNMIPRRVVTKCLDVCILDKGVWNYDCHLALYNNAINQSTFLPCTNASQVFGHIQSVKIYDWGEPAVSYR